MRKSRFKFSLSLGSALLISLAVAGVVGLNFSSDNYLLRNRVAVLAGQLASARDSSRALQKQAARREREQELRLQTALNELRERSQVIESILNAVGVDVAVQESPESAGGPFTRLPDDSYENLTFKVDHYLETIKSVPLGPPVAGTVTSRFGRRVDPINRHAAFHAGVDIKNRPGTPIKAPAAGTVVGRGYTRGYGNFVEIDHGNGFLTRYLHMQKTLVTRGEKVGRGQVVGLLGNTGRSTGPHLHYEIHYHDKAINPMKFMRIARYLKKQQQ